MIVYHLFDDEVEFYGNMFLSYLKRLTTFEDNLFVLRNDVMKTCQNLAKGKIVGNSRVDDTKETSNETKGLKRKAGILQKMEDFEDSRRSP
ncbi:hypothetical protein Tco_0746446 [Tanacetum coccineum]